MENGDEDRISTLPDYLLAEILSRLPFTESAIRTGTLSKRWKDLWMSVHTLIFTHSNDIDCHPHYGQDPNLMSDFVSFVDKTLTQCRQLKLKKFEMHTSYVIGFESKFNNWIRHAISHNVEELEISFESDVESRFPLDGFLFIGSCFTNLKLAGCKYNPSGAISWKNLRSLCIYNGELDKDLIGNMLSGSPVLESLELGDCYGYRRLHITSKSIKSLVLDGYKDPSEDYDDLLDINAPDISSLTITSFMYLRNLLLVNVSSVVEADLNYIIDLQCEKQPIEAQEEMFKRFIMNLCHVKELKIGGSCSKAARYYFKGIKNLVLDGYEAPWEDYDDLLQINAPDILSLTIKSFLYLRKVLLVNVSSVVEADLNYIIEPRCEERPIEAQEEMLKRFIINLRHVKELKIGVLCFKVVSRLEAKGFVFPSNIKLPRKWPYSRSDSVESKDREVLEPDDDSSDNEFN